MDLVAVYAEVAEALESTGLRVYPYAVGSVVVPAALFELPETLDYDATYGRGSDRLVLPVRVVVGKVDARTSHDEILRYTSGAGPQSVKAAVESGNVSVAVRVMSAEFGVTVVAGVEYLSATFNIEVVG